MHFGRVIQQAVTVAFDATSASRTSVTRVANTDLSERVGNTSVNRAELFATEGAVLAGVSPRTTSTSTEGASASTRGLRAVEVASDATPTISARDALLGRIDGFPIALGVRTIAVTNTSEGVTLSVDAVDILLTVDCA